VVTYSIVARDGESGDLGVAVQTRFFGAGGTVPWARPGVGAVATQAFADRRYGALGIELLAAGRSPREALDELTASDPEAAVRQVGVVAADGRAAAHTGADCVPAAGHVCGEGFSAQANMMRSEEVWPAMADAFGASRAPLPWRLVEALDAAEAAGGDFRGKQSAAILVVRGEPSERPWDDKLLDLRVDDHPEPLAELRRLLELADGYRALLQLRESDPSPEAVAALRRLPELDVRWSETFAALRDGDVERARSFVRPLFDAEPRWRGYVASLAARGRLPHADELLRE
jgi:uncharacterized Ntn-hydrolase superfamily protein